jgi:hypothetical protein
MKQILRVRRTNIYDGFNWLKNNNVYYNNTNLNIDQLNDLPSDDIPKTLSENFRYIDVQANVNIGHDNINREEDVDDDFNNDFSMSHSGLANQCESLSLDLIEEINLLKKEKPVVVSMGDVAASGGYYIACGADSIFADANTITGIAT